MPTHVHPPTCPRCGRADQVIDLPHSPVYRHIRTRRLAATLAPAWPIHPRLAWAFTWRTLVLLFVIIAAINGLQPLLPAWAWMYVLVLGLGGGVFYLSIRYPFYIGGDDPQAGPIDWQRQYDEWQHVYYCARDHGLFKPGDPKLTPIHRANRFLID